MLRSFGTALSATLLGAFAAHADPCEADLPASGSEFSGPVTYIVDGDGLCVGESEGGIEIRLADFNAIELNQPGGHEAKAALRKDCLRKNSRLCRGQTVL